MSELINDRDALLLAAPLRLTPATDRALLLDTSAPAGFKMSADGATATPATITFTATLLGMTGTVAFSSSAGLTLTISGNTATLPLAAMTVETGTVTAAITVDGVPYSRTISLAKVRDGTNGVNAAYVVVSAPAQAFTRANSGAAFAPASITLAATPYGGSAAYQWQYWTGSAWANVAGATTATLAVASGAFTDARTYRVQATIGGTAYTDETTLVQLTGGTNGISAITGFLTNESVTLAADSAGTVSSFAPAGGTFKMYDGITDKTGTAGPVTYSVASQTGCTAAITSAGVYSVSAMSADTASATLQAVYGGVTVQKVLSLAKSKAGVTGPTGGAGPTGPRGTVQIAVATAGTAWSSAEADAGLVANGYGAPKVMDMVTLYNAAAKFAQTRAFDGSAWITIAAHIDGNLIVKDSILADRIVTNGLIVRDAAGNPILGVGTPLPPAYAAPGTLNSDFSNGTLNIGGDNLAPNSSFELASNDLATGYGIYNNAVGSEPTVALTGVGRNGSGRAQIIQWTGGHTQTKGIYGTMCKGGWQPGKTYVISFYARTTNLSSVGGMTNEWNVYPAALAWLLNPNLSAEWQRYAVRITMGATVEGGGQTYLSVHTGAGAGNVHFDDLMVSEGEVLTAYSTSVQEAKEDAAAANNAIANISSENVLAKSDKPELILRWAAITGEASGIADEADALGVDRSAYWTSYIALNNYLPVGWNDVTTDTPIVGSTFRDNFADYYNKRQALINALNKAASSMANSDNCIRTPIGGKYTSTTDVVHGALKIRLPQGFIDTMMRFTVDIYEYVNGYSCTLDIAGYNASDLIWRNVSARVSGNSNVEYPVYFGHDGERACVWIGGAGDSWAYPQVQVRDFFGGFTNATRALWEKGWSISFASGGATNVTAQVLDTYPAADWTKTKGKPTDNAIYNDRISMQPDGRLLDNGIWRGQIQSLPTIDQGNGTHFGARNRNDPPVDYAWGTTKQFKETAALTSSDGLAPASLEGYGVLETVKQYVDSSGGGVHQYFYSGTRTFRRYTANPQSAGGGSIWSPWVLDLDRNSYTGDLNATVGAPAGTYVGNTLAQNVLNKAGNDAITGQILLQAAYALLVGTSNDGIYYGSNGIVGRKGGYTTFSVSADGTAIFSGNLVAAGGTLGSLHIAAGGGIHGGAYTSYAWPAAGSLGFYIGPEGFKVGSGNRYFNADQFGDVYAPDFTIINGVATFSGRLGGVMSLSITDNMPASRANTGGATVDAGSLTVNISNGRAPYKIQWSIASYSDSPDWGTAQVSLENAETATVTVKIKCNNNTAVVGFYVCTVVDADGKSATISSAQNVQFGTPT